jgi:CheY-like chemotaxis protein
VPQKAFPSARPASRPARKVLVVDDDVDLREALCELLEEAGYPAAGCANGREALDYLQREKLPCLVLLDLMMPVMSGWEFREEQKKDPQLSEIPVVILSANVKADLFGKSLGVEHTLSRPLSLEALLRVVSEHCG